MVTVLIVEDNLTFRQSLKEMLHTRYPDLKVEEATDGAEALEIINAAVPDFIVMDIRLPGENGLEITRRIKESNPQLPIIILTDYDFAEYREATYRCGADFFIPKGSSTWETFGTLVETILKKASPVTSGPDKEGSR